MYVRIPPTPMYIDSQTFQREGGRVWMRKYGLTKLEADWIIFTALELPKIFDEMIERIETFARHLDYPPSNSPLIRGFVIDEIRDIALTTTRSIKKYGQV